MACRFPGGDDPDSFWQSLLAGRDLVTAIPAARWDVEAYHADSPATPTASGATGYSRIT